MGGGAAGPEGVTVKNIAPAIFGHTVHATDLPGPLERHDRRGGRADPDL